MPTFSDFETFGEPLAITEDRGHVSTVWRARKANDLGDPTFAIKYYAPQRRKAPEGQAEDTLANDPAQNFLAGIKQLQKARSEGVRGLAPIHDFGFADEGVWYATDFYPRNTLKAWIAKKGGVDSAALRNVVYSVANVCLALKVARGYSHGNLKAANIFLVGKPRPLRHTPLHVADAYPAAPVQLARLARNDRRLMEEPSPQVMEVQDLRALGELLLQLAEGRLVTSAYDYNYPIAPSPAWEHLGRDGERWRDLCNRLLDPQLSLDKLSLESLAKEFRPGGMSGKLPIIAGATVILCLVGGGIFWKLHNPPEKSTILKPPELTSAPTNEPPVVTPVVAAPTMEPSGGNHQDSVTVKLTSATPGAVIYYTLDGSEPTSGAQRYSQPITLQETKTVKARALVSGQKDSAVTSATFTVTPTPLVAIAPLKVEVEAGNSASIKLSGSGPPGVKLAFKVETQPKLGQLGELNGAMLAYTAKRDASGPDSFEFTVSDGGKSSARAIVNIKINESLEKKQAREKLDQRLLAVEQYFKLYQPSEFWGDAQYDYLGTNIVYLEGAYKVNNWLDDGRQNRLDKIKSDTRVRNAVKDANKKLGK